MKTTLLTVKRVILATFVVFGIGHGLYAQDTLKSQWIGELGTRNGVTYEQCLNDHFLMRYSGGLMANMRLQPYGYYGKFTVDFEYTGFAPYLSVGTRWYPFPKKNNSGFFLGLEATYAHSAWKFLVDKSDLKYDLGYEFYLMPSVGYVYAVTDRLNLKVALMPAVELSFKRDGEPYWGPNLRGDIGVTYTF